MRPTVSSLEGLKLIPTRYSPLVILYPFLGQVNDFTCTTDTGKGLATLGSIFGFVVT